MARRSISRRTFLNDVGAIGAGAVILPRYVLGGPGYQAPSDTLNIAIVGAGGMGMSNAEQLVSQNIVAVCDVDHGYVQRSLASRLRRRDGTPRPEGVRLQEQFNRANRYEDFRIMLEKQKDIDAVVVATPDHTHAVAAVAGSVFGGLAGGFVELPPTS